MLVDKLHDHTTTHTHTHTYTNIHMSSVGNHIKYKDVPQIFDGSDKYL